MTGDQTGTGPGGSALPGSRSCIGCGGLTFRQREDGLCPRCAFDAETLVERIEVEALEHDLQLLVEFDAYCRQRDEHRERLRTVATQPVFPDAPMRPERDSLDGAPLRLPPLPRFTRARDTDRDASELPEAS